MRYTAAMTSAFQTPRRVLVLSLGALIACSSPGGGGGGGFGGGYSGAPPGQPCQPTSQHEGCATSTFGGTLHVRCDPGTSSWQLVQACIAGVSSCVELPDPASPTSGRKIANCQQRFNSSDGINLADAVTADATTGDGNGDAVEGDADATVPDAALSDVGAAQPGLEATINGETMSSWQFTANASDPTPQQAFVRLSSTGSAPLVLSKITLETDNPYLSLVHANGTDQLPLKIPAGQHVQLGVRYEPAPGKVNLAAGTLRVVPAHDSSDQVKIAFTLQEKKTGVVVLCDNPGQAAYFFKAPGSGKVQRKCTVVNATAEVLQTQSWSLMAQVPNRGAIVAAIFGLDAYVLGQDGQKLVQAPFALAAGLKMVFAVTFYPPEDGKLAAATLVAPWAQGEKTGEISIPVLFDTGS